MAELGLVVNARGAMPDQAELGALGLTNGWLRTIVYSFDELDAALGKLPPRVQVCALLNNETAEVGSGWGNWSQAVGAFAARFRGRVQACEIGNELDLLGVPVATAAKLVNQASNTLRSAGMSVILTSVAGAAWVEYLETLAARTAGAADYANLHGYGQRAAGFPAGWGFGELADAISTANSVSGLPVVLSEQGIKVGDAGGEAGQAEYVRRLAVLLQALPASRCPFACYFAWRDDIGGPTERGDSAFGLRRLDSSARPAWQEFALAQNNVVAVPPPSKPPVERHAEYVLGFKAFFDAAPTLIGPPIPEDPVERGGIGGLSFQESANGFLTAAYVVDPEHPGAGPTWRITFFDKATRARYLFDGSKAVQIG